MNQSAMPFVPALETTREDRRRLTTAYGLSIALTLFAVLVIRWSEPQLALPIEPDRERLLLTDVRLKPSSPLPPDPIERPTETERRPVPVPEVLIPEPIVEPIAEKLSLDSSVEEMIEFDAAVDLDAISRQAPPVITPGVAPEAEPDPVYITGAIVAPRKLHAPEPGYPAIARRLGKTFTVILELTIDRNGHVTEVTTLRDAPMGVGDAAVDAVRKWRFEPATLKGRPVAVRYQLKVRFEAR